MEYPRSLAGDSVQSLESCYETDREVFIEKTTKRLFNEITGCGFKEGYESAEYDHSENDDYF